MEINNLKRLSRWPLSFKIVATYFIITLLIGYFVSLVQVYERSHFDLSRVILYYRGEELPNEESILLPQNFATMLSVAHVHTLSQPLMFAIMGFIYAFSSHTEKKKSFFIALGFIGSLISNGSPWLIRYVTGGMVGFLPLSQLMIMFSLITMTFTSFRQLWFQKNDQMA